MHEKTRVIQQLNELFIRWQQTLANLSESEVDKIEVTPGRNVKDVIGHLRAWQQLSIARLEAALNGTYPILPEWLEGEDPENERMTDIFNHRIFEIYHSQSWRKVKQTWSSGYRKFVSLASAIPEKDYLSKEKFDWMKGYSLHAVLEGSCEHHKEHLDELLHYFQVKSP